VARLPLMEGAGRAAGANVWGIVLAAGSGWRFGRPKQFSKLNRLRLVDHVVIVLPPGTGWGDPTVTVVDGGITRLDSVRAGLSAVPEDVVVVVSDAAHPLASATLYERVIAAVRRGAAAAVPVIPVTEALKRLEDDRVMATVPRTQTVMAQMPQAFWAPVLRAAHAGRPEAAEDSELVERIGATVVTVPGDMANLHVTTPAELDLAIRLLGAIP
jgi:2-C-methyl-D-erythritol 4-phosphate cytidylyltransferase